MEVPLTIIFALGRVSPVSAFFTIPVNKKSWAFDFNPSNSKTKGKKNKILFIFKRMC
jgi:hypothetical protein